MAKKEAAVAAVDFSEGDSLMVDLGSVEEASFEALPKGLYDCVVSENEFVFSQSGGNPMWTITLEVSDGEYAGRKLYTHLVWAGKGLPFTKRTVSKILPNLLEGAFDPQDDELISSVLGLEVRAKVTTRLYDGEMTNNVRDLFPGGGGESFV